jgi:hypothetical protein
VRPYPPAPVSFTLGNDSAHTPHTRRSVFSYQKVSPMKALFAKNWVGGFFWHVGRCGWGDA